MERKGWRKREQRWKDWGRVCDPQRNLTTFLEKRYQLPNSIPSLSIAFLENIFRANPLTHSQASYPSSTTNTEAILED